MIQAHYNIPKRSFGSILENIISHLTPKGCSEYEKIADNMLCDARRLLLDNSRGMRQAVFRWSMAGFMAAGLKLFNGDINKEGIMQLTNERYRPPSSRYGITDYIMTIYGNETYIGKYPLSIATAETARLCQPDYELREFASLAEQIGFDRARTAAYDLQELGKMPPKFNVPLTEDILKKKIEEDKARVYSDSLITDIQLCRFFWDFIGSSIEKAGYSPIKMNGEVLNSMQPELAKDIGLIAAYPTIPAVQIANSMFKEMAGYFTDFGVAVALRRQKEMPDPEYKRIE